MKSTKINPRLTNGTKFLKGIVIFNSFWSFTPIVEFIVLVGLFLKVYTLDSKFTLNTDFGCIVVSCRIIVDRKFLSESLFLFYLKNLSMVNCYYNKSPSSIKKIERHNLSHFMFTITIYLSLLFKSAKFLVILETENKLLLE